MASLLQIQPKSPYVFRLAPTRGLSPSYFRIIAESRKSGCRRFLSNYEDCSNTNVVMSVKDNGRGHARWLFEKVASSPPPPPLPVRS
jgi:hypothetical protein